MLRREAHEACVCARMRSTRLMDGMYGSVGAAACVLCVFFGRVWQEPSKCMRTIAARSINEIWRHHVVQLAITFHGGDHLIAWPWGDMIHCPPGKRQRQRQRQRHDLLPARRERKREKWKRA